MIEKDNPEIPAWMVAQALIIKVKNVLIEEAVNLLYREIEEKRMAVKGKFVKMSDTDGEMEQGMFLIRNLMNQKDEILDQFLRYIETHKEEAKSNAVEASKIRDARKFIDAVDSITAMARASMIFDAWFNGVSMQIHEKDPAAILAGTAKEDNDRRDALSFLVTNQIFKSAELFTKDERAVLTKTHELLK